MLLESENRDIDHGTRLRLQEARATRAVGVAIDELGFLAREALQSGRVGRIAAVFERSFYAVLDGRWICVGLTSIGSGPMHVVCRGVLPRRFAPGMSVAVVGSTLWIDDRPFARLDAVRVWTPEVPPDWTPASLAIGLRVVDEIWRGAFVADGLALAGCAAVSNDPPRLVQFATPGVEALKQVIAGEREQGDAAEPSGLVSLIGLGPGLTPSGDDLLGGALIALAAIGRCDLRDRLWEKCRGFLDRTNEISQVHLRIAALGHGAAVLHGAMHATMSGRVAQVRPAVAALAEVGHTSGRDAFAGVLIVLRMLRDNAVREANSNCTRGIL